MPGGRRRSSLPSTRFPVRRHVPARARYFRAAADDGPAQLGRAPFLHIQSNKQRPPSPNHTKREHTSQHWRGLLPSHPAQQTTDGSICVAQQRPHADEAPTRQRVLRVRRPGPGRAHRHIRVGSTHAMRAARRPVPSRALPALPSRPSGRPGPASSSVRSRRVGTTPPPSRLVPRAGFPPRRLDAESEARRGGGVVGVAPASQRQRSGGARDFRPGRHRRLLWGWLTRLKRVNTGRRAAAPVRPLR